MPKFANLKNEEKTEAIVNPTQTVLYLFLLFKYANEHGNNECFSVVLLVNGIISTAVVLKPICEMCFP